MGKYKTTLFGGMLLVKLSCNLLSVKLSCNLLFFKGQGHQNQYESVGTTKETAFDNPQTLVFVKAGKVFFTSLCMSNLHKSAGSYLCSYVNPYAHIHADNNHRKCEFNCIISCCAHNLSSCLSNKNAPLKTDHAHQNWCDKKWSSVLIWSLRKGHGWSLC